MSLERLLRQRLTVYDKRLFDLLGVDAAAQVIGHLAVVAVSGERLDLDDLGIDLAVHTEDTDPAFGRILNTCAE